MLFFILVPGALTTEPTLAPSTFFECDGTFIPLKVTRRGAGAGDNYLELKSDGRTWRQKLNSPVGGEFATQACLRDACYSLSVGGGHYEEMLEWEMCGIKAGSPWAGRVCVEAGTCRRETPATTSLTRRTWSWCGAQRVPGLVVEFGGASLNVTARCEGLSGYTNESWYYGEVSAEPRIETNGTAVFVGLVEAATTASSSSSSSSSSSGGGVFFPQIGNGSPDIVVTTDRNAKGGEGWYVAAAIAKSDSFGDGWNEYVLRITGDGGTTWYAGTLASGSFEAESVLLGSGCYAIDVDAGYYASEVSWSACGVATGGAPSRGVELCVDEIAGCTRRVSSGATAGTSLNGKLNYSFAVVEPASFDCGGPFAGSLELAVADRKVLVEAEVLDDAAGTSRLVGSSLSVDKEKSGGFGAFFELVFEWTTTSFDAYDVFEGCDVDAASLLFVKATIDDDDDVLRLEIRHNASLRASYSGSGAPQAVGYRLWTRGLERRVVDGDGDASAASWALSTVSHRPAFQQATILVDGNNATGLVSGGEIADCDGPNVLEVRMAPGVETRAAFELCGSTVATNGAWSCGYLPDDDDDDDEDGNNDDDYYSAAWRENDDDATGGGGGAWEGAVSEPEVVAPVDEMMIVAAAADDALARLGAGLAIGAKAAVDAREVRCTTTFDASRFETGTLGGDGLLAGWVDGALVLLEGNPFGAFVVDCASKTLELAIRWMNGPVFVDVCGGASVVEWRCAQEEEEEDDLSWTTGPFDSWPEKKMTETTEGPARCRATAIVDAPRACKNELEACVELVEFATATNINEARAGETACGTLDQPSLCEATCGYCEPPDDPSEATSLETATLPCANLSLELRDQFGDGWNGGTWAIRELDPPDDRDSVRVVGTMADGGVESIDVCLPAGCYSYETTAGSFEYESAWSLCAEEGGLRDRVDFCVDISGTCELLLDRATKTTARLSLSSKEEMGCATLEVPSVAWTWRGYVAVGKPGFWGAEGVVVKAAAGASSIQTHERLEVDFTWSKNCEDRETTVAKMVVALSAAATESILRVDAALSLPAEAPPGFGLELSGYEQPLYSSSEKKSFYYRRLDLPEGWTIDGARNATVLPDGNYTFRGPPTSADLCDGVFADDRAVVVRVEVKRGRCEIAREKKKNVVVPSLAARSHVVSRIREDASRACDGATLRSVVVSVETPDPPPPPSSGDDWCVARLEPGYDDRGKKTTPTKALARTSSFADSSINVEWSNATCDTTLARAAFSWTAEYQYPSLALSVDAAATSPWAGYLASPGDYGLQLELPREQFFFDCADPRAVATTTTTMTTPSKIRAADGFELWVNGVFSRAGFGWATLFEQASLPFRCDGLDVVAARLVADVRAGFRASFALPCYDDDRRPLVLDTTPAWACRAATNASDDLAWTRRSYDASRWPRAARVSDTTTLDAFEAPSRTSDWIWADDPDARVVWCRIVVAAAAATTTLAPTTIRAPRERRYTSSGMPLRAAYKIVAVVVGFALAGFVAFLAYKPLRRRCAANRNLSRFAAALSTAGDYYARRSSRRDAQLNELMLPAVDPPRRPSLAARVAALHHPEAASGDTYFHPLADGPDDDNYPASFAQQSHQDF